MKYIILDLVYGAIKIVKIALNKVINRKMYKNLEQYIPKNTMYCYKVIRFDKLYQECEFCPFHSYILKRDTCLLDGGDCLDDMCKTCGISEE